MGRLRAFSALFCESRFLAVIAKYVGNQCSEFTVLFSMPILVSLMLNELRSEVYKRLVQSIIYLPHFLSWVIIVGICFLILSTDGVVNKLLLAAGFNKFDFL
jgi:putative aldouronate transport system permease protein